jgi:hypothetical protein
MRVASDRVVVATLATLRNAAAAQADSTAPPGDGPAQSQPDAAPRSHSRLPLMAEEARARGYELPLPFGAALVLTGLGNRAIEVTDVRVGIRNSPQSVSEFLDLGSSSDVFNANLKFDAWILPFLNLYALVGYVHNESHTQARVTLPQPGPQPDLVFETAIDTELDGFIGGGGLTLAGGYQDFFMVLDCSYIQTDMGFDDDFTALIASVRTGWNGKFGDVPTQLWVGVGNWDTAATAQGHTDLPNGATLVFEADQRPVTKWMYDVGTMVQFSPKWQLIGDIGVDFDGGYYVVVGPTYRF